jgi:hypothetical protein
MHRRPTPPPPPWDHAPGPAHVVTLAWDPLLGATVLSPTDRYLIVRRGVPVFTTNDRDQLLPFLWGRDITHRYVVFDYETPYPVDTTNLTAWLDRLPPATDDASGGRA